MAPKRGQIETLPGIAAPTVSAELHRARSFGTVTRIEGNQLPDDYFQGLTERMVELADPVNFAKDLYGQNSSNPQKYITSYELDDGPRQTVALTADEFKSYLRSPNTDYLASSVTSGVNAGHHVLIGDSGLRHDKATKAANKALLSKYGKMKMVVEGLSTEVESISKIKEASTHFWLSRGHTDTLLIKAAYITDISIPRMMEVIARQRDWKGDQQDLATRSLEYRLLCTLPDKERMAQWKNLSEVLLNWDQHKINAFKDRMGRIEGRIGKKVIESTFK